MSENDTFMTILMGGMSAIITRSLLQTNPRGFRMIGLVWGLVSTGYVFSKI
jgi:hypothetical protein